MLYDIQCICYILTRQPWQHYLRPCRRPPHILQSWPFVGCPAAEADGMQWLCSAAWSPEVSTLPSPRPLSFAMFTPPAYLLLSCQFKWYSRQYFPYFLGTLNQYFSMLSRNACEYTQYSIQYQHLKLKPCWQCEWGLRAADLQRLHFRAPGRESPGWSQLLHIYLVLAWLRSQESRAGRNYPSDDGGWWGHFKTHSSGYFNIAKCFRQLGTYLQICWCVSVSTNSCVHE